MITPPIVSLNNFPQNLTKNTSHTISGNAKSDASELEKIEVSINGGITWLTASSASENFMIEYKNLEDGNYNVIARAYDSYGNIGISETKTLIIDTLPPIIGGNMISIGPQILTPDENGTIRTVAGTKIALTISMKGGVTEAKIKSDDNEFDLKPISGTNLWTTDLIYNDAGQQLLTILSLDGAGNQTERELNQIVIDAPGKVTKNDSNDAISGAQIKVYFFDTISKKWILWDGESFGQENPKATNENGNYSFLIPPGRYYFEVSAIGYKTVRSQILDLAHNTTLNSSIPLTTKPTLRFKLPFLKEVVLSLPTLRPPKTITVELKPKTVFHLKQKLELGSLAPTLTLPAHDGNLLDTATLHGRYMLAFVSSWSVQSLEQIPIFSQVQRQLAGDQSLNVVFLQESIGSVQTFMRRGKYTFTALSDNTGESTNKFPVTTLPQYFLVDSRGRLQEIHSGVLTKGKLLSKLNGLE